MDEEESTDFDGAQLSIIERRKRVYDLKLKGWSHRQIAEKLSVNISTITMDLRKIMAQVDAARMLESEGNLMYDQLDLLLRRYMKTALKGDLDSTNIVLKIMERKSKLLGLDAPKRIDVRALIVDWAVREGLDPQDVIDVALDLLPSPAAR